jgi:small-conductance mechanosensitive channel
MLNLLRAWGLGAEWVFWGNSLADWVSALAFGLATFALLLLVRRQIERRTRRFAGRELPPGVRFALRLARSTRLLPLLAASLAVGSKYLDLPPRAEHLTSAVIVILAAIQVGIWSSVAVRLYLDESATRHANRSTQTLVTIVRFVANLLIWSTVILLALDNLGVQVKALLTGLGIGGIAVALAVQNILGDLLASVSIALDKPFEVGDSLTLDNGYTGTVEAIGVKSTRLRSISGEQIVIANAEMVKVRIRNYGRIDQRRAVIRFSLHYSTPPDRLARVPDRVQQAVEGCHDVTFERAHLVAAGVNGFEIEFAFVVPSADYALYLSAQQQVLIAIAAALATDGVVFASVVPPLTTTGPNATD